MARARRGQTRPLIDLLAREPYRFDSRQALRIIETDRRRTGGAPVRFRSSLSLAFPISDIEKVDLPADPARRPVVTVNFLGLGGASGPLPTPYTEYLNAALRRRETSGRDFLDVFNHRLVTAAMDIAKLFRPALQPGSPQESNLARQCYALMGLGTPDVQASIRDLAPRLLPLAALINQRPLSAHAIERAVTSYLQLPAQVAPFRGGWLRVPADQRSVLGRGGRHQRLGQSAMLGGRCWAQDDGITLALGPMTAATANGLLPAVSARHPTRHAPLVALLDVMIQREVGVDLTLLVEAASIPRSRLSRTVGLRLGWNSWITRDAGARQRPARLGRSSAIGAARDDGGDGDPRHPGTRLGGARRPRIATVRLGSILPSATP